MRLEKEHGNRSADRRQLVALRVRNPIDQAFSAQAAEIVGRLAMTVGLVEETSDQASRLRRASVDDEPTKRGAGSLLTIRKPRAR